MGWFEGMLQGFNDQRQQIAQEQLRLAQARSDRESALYTHLLDSPDPEIRALAGTGLLSTAAGPQRKGGLRGWIGEMEQSPILGQMRDLMRTPVTHTDTATTLPSRSITGVVGASPGTAGQVATQTTRAGEPPPAATRPDQTPPTSAIAPSVGQPPPLDLTIGAQTPGVTRTTTTQTPRQVFPTPEDLAAQKYRGEYAGEIEGIAGGLMAGGMSREEAMATARDHFLRSRGIGAAGGLQLVHGTDAQGAPAEGMFDKRPGSPTYGQVLKVGTEEPIPGFIQSSIAAPRATDREGMAKELFGKSFNQLTQDQAAQVNARMVQFRGQIAGSTATGTGVARSNIPLSTSERLHAVDTYSAQWNALQAPVREMRRNLLVAQSALANYEKDPNGSSQAVLKAFETILDPRETGVRAGDFGLTKAGQDLFDRVQALYQRSIAGGGQGVTKENLQALLSTATAIVSGMQQFNEPHRQRISKALQDFGVDPADALGADAIVGTAPPTGASTGAPVSPVVASPPPTGGAGGPGGGSAPVAYQDPKTKEWIIR